MVVSIIFQLKTIIVHEVFLNFFSSSIFIYISINTNISSLYSITIAWLLATEEVRRESTLCWQQQQQNQTADHTISSIS
jgi:hypothetical protein